MVFEFERAQRMGDAFDGVGEAVSKVVKRIDAPLVTGIVMGDVTNAI